MVKACLYIGYGDDWLSVLHVKPSARRRGVGCSGGLAACKTLEQSKKSSTILRVARLRHWRRPSQLTELGFSLVAHGHLHRSPGTVRSDSPLRAYF